MAHDYYEDPGWRELCREASGEDNPQKLLELLHEINQALAAQRSRGTEADTTYTH